MGIKRVPSQMFALPRACAGHHGLHRIRVITARLTLTRRTGITKSTSIIRPATTSSWVVVARKSISGTDCRLERTARPSSPNTPGGGGWASGGGISEIFRGSVVPKNGRKQIRFDR